MDHDLTRRAPMLRQAELALVASAAVLLSACSASIGGDATLDREETEGNIAAQLVEMFPDAPEPIITCPDEIQAEVGAAFECQLTVEGDPAVYPVRATVTSLEGDQVQYTFEVGEPE